MAALFLNDWKMLACNGRKIAAFAALVFFLAASALFYGNGEKEERQEEMLHIGVINHDTSIYSKLVTSMYLEGGFFTSYVSVVIADGEEIRRSFESGELDMYVEIPKDFADSMVYLEHLPVQVVISTRNTTVEIVLRNLMESYAKYISAVEANCVALYDIMLDSGMGKEAARRVNERVSIKLILQALAKNDFFEDVFLERSAGTDLGSFFLNEGVFLSAAFFALLCGMRFLKEQQAGIIRRLSAAGVGIGLVLAEKQLFFNLTFTAAAVFCWGVLRLFGRNLPFAAVSVLCLAVYLSAAVFLFFSVLFRKLQNYFLAANLFLLLGAVLGGGIIPYLYFPDGMLSAAKFLPNYWYLSCSIKALSGKLSGAALAAGSAAVLGGIVLLLALAVVVYRKREGRVYENL